jgi:hypothetical protein
VVNNKGGRPRDNNKGGCVVVNNKGAADWSITKGHWTVNNKGALIEKNKGTMWSITKEQTPLFWTRLVNDDALCPFVVDHAMNRRPQ